MVQKSKSLAIWLLAVVGSRNFRIFIYIWFIFQATYMALSTKIGISPDEIYHYSFVQLFAKNGWLPFIHIQAGFYQLGEVVHVPFFLYHYLLSLPFHVFANSTHSLVLLRLINILFSVTSLYLMAKIADKIKLSAVIKNLSLFMLANTLMFVFLTGMLNYDNFFVTLGLLEIYLLICLLEKFSVTQFLFLLIASLTSLLTVINALPIVFITFTILIIKYIRHLDIVKDSVIKAWSKKNTLNVVLTFILIVTSFLFFQRYVINILEFHSITPSCNRINTVAQCRQNPIYVRDESLSKVIVTTPLSTPLSYSNTWVNLMRLRTFGIFGHKNTSPTRIIALWSQILIIISLIALVRMYKKNDRKETLILMISFFYAATLVVINYSSYRHTGLISAAVQGRYLFVILPLLYLIANSYIFKLLKQSYLQAIYVAITLLVFITASLPSYLIKTNVSWYTENTKKINQTINRTLNHIY